MMERYVLPVLGLLFVAWGLFTYHMVQQVNDLRHALSEAQDFIQATKDTTDALSDLPSDPDAVLAELCRIAGGGEGCGDPDPGPASGNGARELPDIQ